MRNRRIVRRKPRFIKESTNVSFVRGIFEDNKDPSIYITDNIGNPFRFRFNNNIMLDELRNKIFNIAKVKWNLNDTINVKNIQLLIYIKTADKIIFKRLKNYKTTYDGNITDKFDGAIIPKILVYISMNNDNIFKPNDKIYKIYIENTYINEYIICGYIKKYINIDHIPDLILYKLMDSLDIHTMMDDKFKYIGNVILNKKESMEVCKQKIYKKFGRKVPKTDFMRLRQIHKIGNRFDKCYYDDKILMKNESLSIRNFSFTKIGIQKLYRKEYLNKNTIFVRICQYYVNKNVIGPVNELPFKKNQTILSFFNDLCVINDMDRKMLKFTKIKPYIVNNPKHYSELNTKSWTPRVFLYNNIEYEYKFEYNDDAYSYANIKDITLKNFYKNGSIIVFKQVSMDDIIRKKSKYSNTRKWDPSISKKVTK